MIEEHKEAFSILFSLIYKDNKEATRLSFGILNCLHVWDDLIDKDTPISDSDINTAFFDALITIGASPLWTPDMGAHMLNVYVKWRDANYIEANTKHDDNELAKAWMLRASCYDLFVLLAIKLYGIDWGVHIGPTVRAAYGEKLVDFIQETKNA